MVLLDLRKIRDILNPRDSKHYDHRRNLNNRIGVGAISTMGIGKSDAPILRPVKRRFLIFSVFSPPKLLF